MAYRDIKAGAAYIEFFIKDSRFLSQLRVIEKEFQGTLFRMSRSLKNIGFAGLKISGPALAGFILPVNQFMEFEKNIQEVYSILGSGGKYFRELEDHAKKMGAVTIFSSSQVARAMTTMVRKGLEHKDVLQATRPALDAAAVGHMGLAEASEIVLGVMKGMAENPNQVDWSKTADKIDVLTKATVQSSADLQTMGDAFRYVGPLSQLAGLQIEEVAAAIMGLADANVTGEMAGTTLRGVLLALNDPSKEAIAALNRLGVEVYDQTGNFNGLINVIAQFEKALEGMGRSKRLQQIGKIFQQRQAAGIAQLINVGSGSLSAKMGDLGDSKGFTNELANIQLDTLWGDWIKLTSVVTNFMIEVGNAIPLRAFLQAANEIVVMFTEWVKNNKQIVFYIGGLVTALFLASSALIGLGVALGIVAFAFAGFGKLLWAMAIPLGLTGKGVVALASAILNPFKRALVVAIQGLRILVVWLAKALHAMATLAIAGVYKLIMAIRAYFKWVNTFNALPFFKSFMWRIMLMAKHAKFWLMRIGANFKAQFLFWTKLVENVMVKIIYIFRNMRPSQWFNQITRVLLGFMNTVVNRVIQPVFRSMSKVAQKYFWQIQAVIEKLFVGFSIAFLVSVKQIRAGFAGFFTNIYQQGVKKFTLLTNHISNLWTSSSLGKGVIEFVNVMGGAFRAVFKYISDDIYKFTTWFDGIGESWSWIIRGFGQVFEQEWDIIWDIARTTLGAVYDWLRAGNLEMAGQTMMAGFSASFVKAMDFLAESFGITTEQLGENWISFITLMKKSWQDIERVWFNTQGGMAGIMAMATDKLGITEGAFAGVMGQHAVSGFKKEQEWKADTDEMMKNHNESVQKWKETVAKMRNDQKRLGTGNEKSGYMLIGGALIPFGSLSGLAKLAKEKTIEREELDRKRLEKGRISPENFKLDPKAVKTAAASQLGGTTATFVGAAAGQLGGGSPIVSAIESASRREIIAFRKEMIKANKEDKKRKKLLNTISIAINQGILS
jgi:TP901 family phage tail tape measure protein